MEYAKTKPGIADKMAVLGMAYEELGKRISISVQDLTQMLQQAVSPENRNIVSAKSLDLNNDDVIDLAEYSASILIEDMLSSNKDTLDFKNINGTVTSDGQNELYAYANVNNFQAAQNNLRNVYDTFSLNTAQNEFLSNPDNIQK